MSYDTIVEAHAMRGKMPKSSELSVRDEDGWTVAHYLAAHNALPAGFDDWLLADRDGITVAHVAAVVKKLPLDFPHWKVMSESGATVFHIACKHGTIDPMSKAQFDKICNIKDQFGRTPYDLYMDYGNSKIEGMRKILRDGKV